MNQVVSAPSIKVDVGQGIQFIERTHQTPVMEGETYSDIVAVFWIIQLGSIPDKRLYAAQVQDKFVKTQRYWECVGSYDFCYGYISGKYKSHKITEQLQ